MRKNPNRNVARFLHDPEAYLLPHHTENRERQILTNCWRTVCADAEVGGLCLYDLRHRAASHTIMSGKKLPLVGKLLGQRPHQTTAGYAHPADEHLVEAGGIGKPDHCGADGNTAFNGLSAR